MPAVVRNPADERSVSLSESTVPSMLRSLLIVAILIPGVVAAVRSRFAALLLYIWFALFRPQEWLWVDTTSLRLSLMIGMLFVVPCLVTGVFPTLSHPISVGALLLLGAGLLSQVYSVQPDLSWPWVDFFARLILVCLLLVTLTNTRRRFLIVMAVTALSFAFHAAKAGLLSFVVGGVRFGDGLSGAYIDNNGYALATVMVIPLVIATAQNVDRAWLRRGLYAAVPLCIMTVISTFSRAGFLGLCAAAVVFVALQRRRILGFIGLALIAVVWLVAAPIPQGYVDRVQTIQTYREVEDDSTLSRLHFWRVAFNMALDRPFGVGLRNYDQAYDAYDFQQGRYGHNRSVHSSHLEVLAEMGFFGFAVYLVIMALSMRALLRVRARAWLPNLSPEAQRFYFTTANALIASLAGFIVAGAFIALALNDLTWLTVALVIALDRLPVEAPAAAPKDAQPIINPWTAPELAAKATS